MTIWFFEKMGKILFLEIASELGILLLVVSFFIEKKGGWDFELDFGVKKLYLFFLLKWGLLLKTTDPKL